VTKRMLIIEDRDDDRTIMRDLLNSAGYRLIGTIDADGVKPTQSERPDIILMVI
jgi:response regulator RpfG family c-di-GMP phosphodiesterase